MAMIKLIVLLLIISSTCKLWDFFFVLKSSWIWNVHVDVESRALRKRRQYSSGYYGQSSYPYSGSGYGAGSYYPSSGSYGGYPYNTYGTGSMYGTNYYGGGLGGGGLSGVGGVGVGGIGGIGSYGGYGQNPYNTYGGKWLSDFLFQYDMILFS